MRLVYIAAPLTPTQAEISRAYRDFPHLAPERARDNNRERASRWCEYAARQGVAPSATWIVLSGLWDDSAENRVRGLRCDFAAIERCDELWLVGGRVSRGMDAEAWHARAYAVPVVDLTPLGEEPPR